MSARERQLNIRLSHDEWRRLQTQAKDKRLSPAEYLRMVLKLEHDRLIRTGELAPLPGAKGGRLVNCPHAPKGPACANCDPPMTDDEKAWNVAWELAHCKHDHERPGGTRGPDNWCGVCGAHRAADGTWLRHQIGADAKELDDAIGARIAAHVAKARRQRS